MAPSSVEGSPAYGIMLPVWANPAFPSIRGEGATWAWPIPTQDGCESEFELAPIAGSEAAASDGPRLA
jgi:hypothetical protein